MVAHEQHSANQADSSHACLLLKQSVSVPLTFKSEPAGFELVCGVARFGAATFQVSNKTDAFGLKEAKRFPSRAFCPENGDEIEGLLAEADRQMYMVKKTRKNFSSSAEQNLLTLAAALEQPSLA